ncbi:MutS-related protein [Granulicella sibirica]|uniref:MutS-related protein, family 1 n=1 Tax=Granulicella sibirica TaxID=2479048 RepID=A0A4Q0T102_9BACT|nr:hypothetical protein [Granulicella sibirica]RXH55076.1 MutS-related protein, family 1 [Granulicella sibirica]
MAGSPEAFYKQRLTELDAGHRQNQSYHDRLLLGATVAVLLFAGANVGAFRHALPGWAVGLAAVPAIGLIFPFLKSRRERERLTRSIALYEAGVARVTHQPAKQPQTGEVFRDPAHLYDRDLNILGRDSLFATLATTRTGWGQRALAGSLLVSPSREETLARQEAIRELAPGTQLRQELAMLGSNALQPTAPETFDHWLAEPAAEFPSLLRPLLYVTSSFAGLLLLAWLAGRLPLDTLLPNLAAVLGLQAAVALRYRAKVLPILEATAPLPGQVQILRDGLALLRKQNSAARHLVGLQESCGGADEALADLQKQLFVVEQRKTELFYLPGLVVNAGTHASVRIDRWKRLHGGALRGWIAAFGSFDALSALATYAFEHPENCFPEMLSAEEPATFEATLMTHPLLPNAVANDISLNAGERFYLISGSNMAGKSTLLRAIGLTVVLARAGCPVPARRARLSPLKIGVSLALTDSLTERKSKFLAEVHRLREILLMARRSPALFLIDELFSGTNSSDRLTAAEAVLDELLTTGAIGALSTHDLALTTLATDPRRGVNVHMASPDLDDPLAFDYVLKPGVNTRTNALAFLRLLNLGSA